MKKLVLFTMLGSIFVNSTDGMSLIDKTIKENQTQQVGEPSEKAHGSWTPAEDSRLKDAVIKYGEHYWTAIEADVGTRDNKTCRVRWTQQIAPSNRNIGQWSKDESDRLKTAVAKHGEHNWIAVAADVGTRTNQQCSRHWERKLAQNIKHGPWSAEEDRILIDKASELCTDNRNPWAQIAKFIKGRTAQQCEVRARSIFNQPWSEDEDNKLIELAAEQKEGINWQDISKHFNCRTAKKCRERWMNYLNPDIKRTEWTKEEDNIIVEQVREIGQRWERISQFLPGRVPNQIKNRYLSVLCKNTIFIPLSNIQVPQINIPKLKQHQIQSL